MQTLIFDIGKTNKKVFLFDQQYNIIYEESHRINEIKDEDGDPCDDLDSMISWIYSTLEKLLSDRQFIVSAINFSSFGASFVHTNESGKPILPLYSYLKPLSPALKNNFFKEYGPQEKIARETASPVLDSLNSGLQLYRLKYEKSLTTQKGFSLHLPQFLSSLVTGKAYSDITSIGCHTMLWNFEKNDYHEWVHREGIINRLAPIHSSSQLLDAASKWGNLKAGVGLHDSSSATIPYLASFKDPFVLISTGTWSISLNPFNQAPLNSRELEQDCLCFLSYRGKVVKASRLFAGHEHEEQEKRIAEYFGKRNNYYNSVVYNHDIVTSLKKNFQQDNRAEFIPGSSLFSKRDPASYSGYEEAYHQLILDIVSQQILSTNLVLKGSDVKKIYIDGGFSKNKLYMNLLAEAYRDYEVYSASVAQASAIGAAMAVSTTSVPGNIVQVIHHPVPAIQQ